MYNDKKIKIFEIIALSFNLLIIIFIFLFCYFSLRYEIVTSHDFVYPYINERTEGRLASFFLCHLLYNSFPQFLLINLNDFRTYFINALIALSIISCSLIWTKAFFLTNRENTNIYNRPESIVTIITSFLLFTILPPPPPNLPVNLDSLMHSFMFNAREITVFLEYHFLYIFVFSFFIFLYFLTSSEKTTKNRFKIYLFVAFFSGVWNEQFSLFILFSVIAFSFLLFLFDKNLLRNSQLLKFIILFLLGFTLEIVSKSFDFSNNKLNGHEYTISSGITYFFHYYKDFFHNFYRVIFLSNIYQYLTLIILFTVTLFHKNKKLTKIVVLTISILIGFFILNLSYGLFINTSNLFLFEKTTNRFMNALIPSYCIFLLLGAIYLNIDKKINKFLVFLFLFSLSLYYSHFLVNNYSNILKIKKIRREALYKLDKTVILYSKLGKIAKVPISIFSDREMGSTRLFIFQDRYTNMRKNEIDEQLINKIITPEKSEYTDYVENNYKITFYGYQIVDDEAATAEITKELSQLKINDNIQYGSFTKLNEFKEKIYSE